MPILGLSSQYCHTTSGGAIRIRRHDKARSFRDRLYGITAVRGLRVPLSEVLLLVQPRERAGARSGAALSFQKDWAICELLNRHESAQSYLLACEFHDDVVVVEDPNGEAHMHFFQVKVKRTGTWNIHNLTTPVGGESMSIVGKLYDNKLKFPTNTASLSIVSNAPFKIKLAKGKEPSASRQAICLAEAAEDEREVARNAVQGEHHLSEPPAFESYTHLRVTDLSVGDSSGHALGKVERFLSRRAPMRKRHAEPFYRTLFTEVTRLSDHVAPVTSYDEFLQYKALSRDRVEGFVEMTVADLDLDQGWTSLESRLNSEGLAYSRILAIHSAWRHYEVDRLDVRLRPITKLRSAVNAWIATHPTFSRLTDVLNELETDDHVRTARSNLFSVDYTAAVALMEIYERHEEPELPPTHPESEETGQ